MRVAALLLGLVTASLAVAPAFADVSPTFRFEQSITPGAPGPQRLPVDVPLLADADPGRALADLRLYDTSGHELGYLLVAPTSPAPVWKDARLVPGQEARDESSFEADLGAPVEVDGLELAGLHAPFVKRVRVEASVDRAHWVTLANDATLFDLPDDKLHHLDLPFDAGVYRYFHVTWDDHSSTRLALPGHVAARLHRQDAPEAPLVAPLVFDRRVSEPRTSRFHVRLPGVRLPLVALEVECAGTGALLRPARVLEPRFGGQEVTPAVLGRGTLRRATHDGLTASDLRIPIEAPRGADLELVVDDGDNAPLELTAVRAVFAAEPWIYFETKEAGPLVARFGNAKLSEPHYDLEAMRGAVSAHAQARATWGDARPTTPADATAQATEELPVEGGALERTGFAYARPIAAGKRGLTAVLLDVAVLAHAHGTDDLRILDASGHQVPYLVEKRDEPLTLDLPLTPEPARASGAVPGESRYRITLPYATLPSGRLLVTTPSHVFERDVHLEVDNPEPLAPRAPPTRTLVDTRWSHTDPETAAPPFGFDLPSLGADHVVLDVEEGDNRPLPVAHAALHFPATRLRFFRTDDAPLTLLYGRSDVSAPRYDLALLAPRLVGLVADEVGLAPEVAPPAPTPPSSAPRNVFWGALVVAVLVLLGLIARLIRKTDVA